MKSEQHKGRIGHTGNEKEDLSRSEAQYYYRLYKQNGTAWWSEKKQKLLIKHRGNIDELLIEMQKLRQQEKRKT